MLERTKSKGNLEELQMDWNIKMRVMGRFYRGKNILHKKHNQWVIE